MISRQKKLFTNRWLPLLASSVLAFFAALYVLDRHVYQTLIGYWAFLPFPDPFLDARYISAQVTCWQKGVDVYVNNPCDVINRPLVYSPVWLRFSFLAQDRMAGEFLGLAEAVIFVVSLGLFPKAGRRSDFIVMALAVLSPTTFFAVERGNIDLLVFEVTLAGILCLERSLVFRAAGYMAFVLATILNFYPVFLLGRLLDERPSRFAAIGAVAAACVAAFVLVFGHEIRSALAHVPVPSAFGDGFGARQLGDGVAPLLGRGWVAAVLTGAATLIAAVAAFRIARLAAFQRAFTGLGQRASGILIAGALLFCGCFVSGSSVGYRGVLLLFVLPGLLEMAHALSGSVLGRWVHRGAAAIVVAMWNFIPMRAFGPHGGLAAYSGPLPFFGIWILREALWWFAFAILLSVVFAFIRTARMNAAFSSVFLRPGARESVPRPL